MQIKYKSAMYRSDQIRNFGFNIQYNDLVIRTFKKTMTLKLKPVQFFSLNAYANHNGTKNK